MSTNQENKSAKVKKGALFALVVLAISSGFYFLYFEDTVENYSSSPVAFQNSKPEPGIAIQSDPNEYSVVTEGPTFKILMPEKLEREKIEAPIINPPIPHLVQPAIATRVNANIGQNINTNHHSLINIPPRAFVDKNGHVVTGDVDVLYKEYYTPLDIFLSGIPMKYDSGANEQLVSAGMIEITAMKNNEPLYVNKENKINVMLASLSGDPDYSIYYYDTNKDMNAAIQWIQKSNQMDAQFWKLRVESLILARLGRKAEAIEAANKSKAKAIEAKNDEYVKMNEMSIKEWSN